MAILILTLILVLIHLVTRGNAFAASRISHYKSQLRQRQRTSRFSSLFSSNDTLSNRRQAVARILLGAFPFFAMSADATTLSKEEAGSETRSVGWGIVGLGDVCAVKAGPAFYKATGSKLVAVMRRTPGAAEEWVKENMPDNMPCRGYDSLDKFLADPELDAVYIATPPGSHLEVAKKVAAAGKPAYIEKPVGRCGWETEAIVKAFTDKGVPLYTAYVSRAYERTNAIIRLLKDEKVVGDRITSIKYTLRGSEMARGLDWSQGLPWRLNAAKAGGGLIMDVGCHVVDRIDYLCGPIVNVQGTALNRRSSQKQDVEDFVDMRAEIGPSSWAAVKSVAASVECTWDFSAAESLDELVISGPGGSLKMAAMSPSLPITVLGPNREVLQQLTFEPPQHAAQPLIQAVTNELRGIPGAVSPSRGDNAVRASKVLDEALNTYYGGRQDEFWLRPESWPGGHDA